LPKTQKKKGVTVLASGLQYQVVKAGDGAIPNAEDTVTVEFRGSLIDGTEFASSKKRGKPARLKVNRIIKGLSEALQLMPTGSKWRLYIPANLAYGNRSPGSRVPANSTLIYEIELLSIKSAAGTAAAAKQEPGTPEAKQSSK
jgi:FKBP-type peptidyl-prolyl cis-trans isomerase